MISFDRQAGNEYRILFFAGVFAGKESGFLSTINQ